MRTCTPTGTTCAPRWTAAPACRSLLVSRPAAAVAAVAEAARGVIDWRVERLRSLPGEAGLGSEWDACLLLLGPRPGGPLARRDQCQVDGCERDQHGASPLCGGHAREFARSGQASVADWRAAGEPHLSGRRWLSAQTCIVAAAPDPAPGRGRRRRALPRPRPGLGGCAPGRCRTGGLPRPGEAAARIRRVRGGLLLPAGVLPGQPGFVVHYRIWCEQGRPSGPGVRRLGGPGPPARQRPGAQPAGPAGTGSPGTALRDRAADA